MEVQPEIITVLADAAENVREIDMARAEAARRRAEEYIAKGPPPDTDTFLAMEAALKRSNLRLEAARRFGHGQNLARFLAWIAPKITEKINNYGSFFP